ncbi:ABC transporter, periplasmic substrate-binding protein, putative [Fulvimarina pelagi HTCC2506]|uniref:ABC transporter, periplasmic substrate-binding protein, putative n=2 Tax=Fulvimarina pelagi TaxID=217511 RepID=Q0G7R1_9HYPH|nr:ABC transporter, periplasmic substrate-binding protein, putative [Fulvimarina pelagi HTCC2506]
MDEIGGGEAGGECRFGGRRDGELMASASTYLTRRRFGQLAFGSAASLGLPLREALANVETGVPLHGLSAFGELKYAEGFDHFDYANPDAPEGGTFAFSPPNWAFNQSALTFDTLNTFVLKGNAPPRMTFLYEGLMTSSLDEPDAIYGALAETVTVSEDRLQFDFMLRPEAKFSTGDAVTPEDVVFSYETLAEFGHPSIQIALRDFKSAEVVDERTAQITFDANQSYQDAIGVLSLPILPRTFFEGRSLDEPTDEIIPGSGRYTVGRYEFGRFIEYEKREDYWGEEQGFAKGLDHFQTLRIDFFRERQTALEAFKKGLVKFREEFTSKSWATEYNFPAIQSGEVVKREFPAELFPRFQCWALNQRRERFADVRVRRAINLCFDFEWTNANMFYGLYDHSQSCFENSEFMAEGAPSEAELALLEPLRGEIPEEVFGEVWTQPVSDGSGRDRDRLREALDLLQEAGYERQGGRVRDKNGQPFQLEYLVDDPGFARVYGKFVQTCQAIGIDASVRVVDAAQYTDRTNRFDFDMIGHAAGISPTPTTNGLRSLFGSETADRQGSSNYPGMASAAVDRLIENVGEVNGREDLVTAMRALDRVLRARLDWIPNIHSNAHRAAYWDIFGFDTPKPDYGWPVERLWWIDETKS